MEIWKKMWVGVFFLNTVYSIVCTLVLEKANSAGTEFLPKARCADYGVSINTEYVGRQKSPLEFCQLPLQNSAMFSLDNQISLETKTRR